SAAPVSRPAPRAPATPAESEPPRPARSSAAQTHRVDFERMNGLVELAGELLIAQAGLSRLQKRLSHAHGRSPDLLELEEALIALGRTQRALQSSLMEARLVPISTLFARFGRFVRDLSREGGHPARLETIGGGTSIDKAMVDRLREPMLHLVRNAVAHGIEAPEERLRAGKPAEGRITISALNQGDRVRVAVADDG